MWTHHQQQQQRGAQMHARDRKPRQPGAAPGEAVRDRSAQDHESAGGSAQPGDYPASPVENRRERAPGEAAPAWDDVVQPEQRRGGTGPLSEAQ